MASYEHGLEFDAYLAGKKEEQERIIKLLREVGYPESTITLIKGEQ